MGGDDSHENKATIVLAAAPSSVSVTIPPSGIHTSSDLQHSSSESAELFLIVVIYLIISIFFILFLNQFR